MSRMSQLKINVLELKNSVMMLYTCTCTVKTEGECSTSTAINNLTPEHLKVPYGSNIKGTILLYIIHMID